VLHPVMMSCCSARLMVFLKIAPWPCKSSSPHEWHLLTSPVAVPCS
jgi:hypothetical protein